MALDFLSMLMQAGGLSAPVTPPKQPSISVPPGMRVVDLDRLAQLLRARRLAGGLPGGAQAGGVAPGANNQINLGDRLAAQGATRQVNKRGFGSVGGRPRAPGGPLGY